MLIKGLSAGDHELLTGAAGPGGVGRVLSRCLSPPAPVAVAGATRLLRQMGAFDSNEELTALGGHLNRMPMDPGVGEPLAPCPLRLKAATAVLFGGKLCMETASIISWICS